MNRQNKINNEERDLTVIVEECIGYIDETTKEKMRTHFNEWGCFSPERFQNVLYKALAK